MKKAGVKDIAKLAEVSTGTVDRVLNKRGRVSEKTKEKVLRIADELGYQPNLLAKSLSSKKRLRFAVVIPESHENNPYWEIPIHGIDRARDELSNHNVDFIYKCYNASDESSFKSVLEEVINNGIDGLVFSPFYKDCSIQIAEQLNASNIPFVFVDVNVEGVGKLAYFGQDSRKSGEVAAMLMSSGLKGDSNVLVVKQARKKVFSDHLEDRVLGFLEFLKDTSIQSDVLEINLEDKKEPHHSLKNKFGEKNPYQGVFIPNSRGFKVVDFLEEEGIEGLTIIGYDLVEENVKHLENNKMTFLLHQKPKEQTYNAVMALFNHLVFKKEINKTNYSPIDIVIKQNVEYFK